MPTLRYIESLFLDEVLLEVCGSDGVISGLTGPRYLYPGDATEVIEILA